jgi:hypothetical protein
MEVCSVTRAVMLSDVNRLNDYPDHYNQAFAFSAILYPTSHRLSLRSAFLSDEDLKRRTGLPRFTTVTGS